MIDLFYPFVPEEAKEEVAETLSGRWIGQAHKVDKFEKEFEKLFNVQHAVALNSGTSALETAYDLMEFEPGDEVISTPMTCSATNIPLLARKVKIVWADILPDTMTLDPIDVKRKLTGKTKAIVNVHLGGIESDIGKQPVPVISDACQALGIFTGDYTCNSFQAIKHITTGDGGMITCPDKESHRKAKLMRWFGIDREKKIQNNWQCYTQRAMTFDIEIIGYKRQMTDIAAGMGLAGLKWYYTTLAWREALFNRYKYNLKVVSDIRIVDGPNNKCWLLTVYVNRRDDFAEMLFDSGVHTNLVHIRNDLYSIFGGRKADLPYLDQIEKKYICLPLHPKMKGEDVDIICDKIKKGW